MPSWRSQLALPFNWLVAASVRQDRLPVGASARTARLLTNVPTSMFPAYMVALVANCITWIRWVPEESIASGWLSLVASLGTQKDLSTAVVVAVTFCVGNLV